MVLIVLTCAVLINVGAVTMSSSRASDRGTCEAGKCFESLDIQRYSWCSVILGHVRLDDRAVLFNNCVRRIACRSKLTRLV